MCLFERRLLSDQSQHVKGSRRAGLQRLLPAPSSPHESPFLPWPSLVYGFSFFPTLVEQQGGTQRVPEPVIAPLFDNVTITSVLRSERAVAMEEH
ncbi:hypothetical protein JZ751_006708, partial [Albula glossodonta]